MPGRYRQLRMRDPDVFLLLPATSLAHRHARILRTFPVDLFSFCFTYPDLHHGLLGYDAMVASRSRRFGQTRNPWRGDSKAGAHPTQATTQHRTIPHVTTSVLPHAK